MPRYVFAPNDGLKVIGIRDVGNLSKERVVLRSEKFVNLIQFLVLNGHGTDDNKFGDMNDSVFWFPPGTVAAGDYVRLYTRAGKNLKHQGTFNNEPATYHDFFWRKTRPMWTGNSNAAVLVEIAQWSMLKR